MQLITALYLAHLNPVTNAHVEIISELKKEAVQCLIKNVDPSQVLDYL